MQRLQSLIPLLVLVAHLMFVTLSFMIVCCFVVKFSPCHVRLGKQICQTRVGKSFSHSFSQWVKERFCQIWVTKLICQMWGKQLGQIWAEKPICQIWGGKQFCQISPREPICNFWGGKHFHQIRAVKSICQQRAEVSGCQILAGKRLLARDPFCQFPHGNH